MLIPLILFEYWATVKFLHDADDDDKDDDDKLVIKIAHRQAKNVLHKYCFLEQETLYSMLCTGFGN